MSFLMKVDGKRMVSDARSPFRAVHEVLRKNPDAEIKFCCSCCFKAGDASHGLQEVGDLDGSPTVMCHECAEKLEKNHEFIRCIHCKALFRPHSLKTRGEDKLCPFCNRVWNKVSPKKTFACNVLIQRPYLCYVRVDEDASDAEIEETVKKKILEGQESVLVEDNDLEIEEQDITRVNVSYEVIGDEDEEEEE